MNETEIKNEQTTNTGNIGSGTDRTLQPSDMFWKQQESQSTNNQDKSKEEVQFIQKGANRKLDEPYDIHFMIGGETFNKIITFLNGISYDVAFIFRKKEVILSAVDGGNTHISVVKFSHTEFTDYTIKGLENENNEKGVIIDISVIIEKLPIKDDVPVDFYVDTLVKNRFYVINGKGKIERQLHSDTSSDGSNALMKKHINFSDTIKHLLNDTTYQKIVVNQVPLVNTIGFLSKQVEKNKTTWCKFDFSKHYLDFKIDTDVDRASIILSGDEVVVYPLENDVWQCNLEFFSKLGKLKMNNMVSLYVCGEERGNSLPLIVETRCGGGGILLHYLIAPKVDG